MVDAGGAPRAAEALHYGRHFALLVGLAGLAALLGQASVMPGPVASFALYGAMHAGALALCLRAAQPLRRKLLFISLAALISLSIAFLGVHAAPLAAGPRGVSGLRSILAATSILGALSYGWLIRALRVHRLRQCGARGHRDRLRARHQCRFPGRYSLPFARDRLVGGGVVVLVLRRHVVVRCAENSSRDAEDRCAEVDCASVSGKLCAARRLGDGR